MVKKNIEFIPDFRLSKLKKYKNNPKVNDKTIEALSKSLNRFGAIAPIIVNEEFIICDGHARYDAAIERGDKTFPVLIAPQLIGDNFKAYNIAATQTARLAEWDEPILAEIIKSLADSGYEIDSLGFDGNELEDIMNSLDDGAGGTTGLTDPDEVPEPPKKPITKPGDLWQLGRHRLLCGDATKAGDLKRLMNNKIARIIFTDPPWNVNIGGDNNPRHRQRTGMKNDKLSESDYKKFLNDFIRVSTNYHTGDLYCVLGAAEWPKLDLCLRDAGYHWSSTIIWLKDIFVLGRSNYHRRYEPIWYGWKSKGKSSFNGQRDLDDVWEFKRPMVSPEHPTMKPIELVVKAITNSTKVNNSVIDPFVGSGTTIIACEQTGRTCYAMEIEPIYCDVSVKRWENFTGQKAKRI